MLGLKNWIVDATDVDDLQERLPIPYAVPGEIVSRDVRDDEFWDPPFKRPKTLTKDNEVVAKVWAADNVLVADLVLGSLGKQIRDLGELGLLKLLMTWMSLHEVLLLIRSKSRCVLVL